MPVITLGMIEASATRNPPTALTLLSPSTTASGSTPKRHVPDGWYEVLTLVRRNASILEATV